eukprot:72347_1
MAFRLLSHELYAYGYCPKHKYAKEFKHCPEYIKDMLHSHCINVVALIMRSEDVVMNYVFGNTTNINGWINLELITTVFPNLESLFYLAFKQDVKLVTESSFYCYVLTFIKKRKYSSINEIIIRYNPKYQMQIKEYIKKYKPIFANCGWTLNIEHISSEDKIGSNVWRDVMYSILKSSNSNKSHSEEFEHTTITFRRRCKKPDTNDDEIMNVLNQTVPSEQIFDCNTVEIATNILRSYSLSKPSHTDGCKSDLLECESFRAIQNVLKLYSHYLKSQRPNKARNSANDSKCIFTAVFSKMAGNYNNVDLLNNYNHLLSHHKSQFEDIYTQLTKSVYQNKSCNLAECLPMRRNQRNRERIKEKEYLLNDLYCNYEDVASEQLLDRTHSFYFHTFDTGYRLTNNEKRMITTSNTNKNKIDNNSDQGQQRISQINSILKSKRSRYKNIIELNGLSKINNKFVTEHNKIQQYSSGFRFYYWTYGRYSHQNWEVEVRNCRPGQSMSQAKNGMYVTNKYKNLKQELTQNELCHLGQHQWMHLMQKAQIHIQTNFLKTFYCVRNKTAKCYDMYYRELISVGHLIVMMVYCNFDTLQRIFSETFRKLNKNETDDDLKKRHGHYYFLARLLRECVECFGTRYRSDYSDNDHTIRIYCGLDKRFHFKSINPYLNSPFSTTTEYAVAVQFADNKGMLLQLGINAKAWRIAPFELCDAEERLSFFNMQQISDFSGEAEIFCMGGLNQLNFQSITEASGVKDYEFDVAGLNMLLQNLNSSDSALDDTTVWTPTMHSKKYKMNIIQQMAFRLLSHELHKYMPNHPDAHPFKSCPKYIKTTLHLHCLDVHSLTMGIGDVIKKYLFMDKETEWIDVGVITTVFPNIQILSYNAMRKDAKWVTQPAIYANIFNFITQDGNSSLKEIIIQFNQMHYEKVVNCIEKYKNLFGECINNLWSINIELMNGTDTDNIDLIDWRKMMFKILKNVNIKQIVKVPKVKKYMELYGICENSLKTMIMNPDRFDTLMITIRKRS